MKKLISKSHRKTFNLGLALARKLKKGDIIGLVGDLGAGKTVFTKGIAAGLGIDPLTVTSPTFTLINEYEGKKGKLFHFDLYRIDSSSDLEALGYEEYFFNDGIVVIEWADKCESLLPPKSHIIRMKYLDTNKREIIFDKKRSA
ncbi:MAG: tRNA (adenosine(37)-N6)-threonylcarbamoyltransferase complex ATPase subunit type 1 TsaE [Spirochaetes bacterium]|nr:tRNA (adenosine(37)-N6)-threonylcarbamoyltransferase complex ATPase subunit type 1 TsaE [Spirochaetota bacterium]